MELLLLIVPMLVFLAAMLPIILLPPFTEAVLPFTEAVPLFQVMWAGLPFVEAVLTFTGAGGGADRGARDQDRSQVTCPSSLSLALWLSLSLLCSSSLSPSPLSPSLPLSLSPSLPLSPPSSGCLRLTVLSEAKAEHAAQVPLPPFMQCCQLRMQRCQKTATLTNGTAGSSSHCTPHSSLPHPPSPRRRCASIYAGTAPVYTGAAPFNGAAVIYAGNAPVYCGHYDENDAMYAGSGVINRGSADVSRAASRRRGPPLHVA
eukprot:1397059-Rhodomonas_salina.3